MENIKDTDNMLANLDRVMRQLRRRPKGTRHGARGTYRLLKKVSLKPGISTKELADTMDIRRASLNEKLVILENEGMIRRERDSKDQRIHVVYLEPEGKNHLIEIKELIGRKKDSITSILTLEEIRKLEFLTDKLASGLEKINEGRGEMNGK